MIKSKERASETKQSPRKKSCFKILHENIIIFMILYVTEEFFQTITKIKYNHICKLCICTHGIKNDFIMQTDNKKQLKKLYEQHQKIIFTF